MGMLQEFKEFAIKGNAMDMAVGIILGLAFNKVVNSLVNDIIMPPIGLVIGGVDFKNLKMVLKEASVTEAGQEVAAVTMNYGLFINNIIDFLIVAFSVFVIVKIMNKAIAKREAPAA